MATLNTTIAVFYGHDLPADGAPPLEFCTVREFQTAYPDFMDGDTLQECLDALDADGCWRYGGGAFEAFIALRVDPVHAPLAAPDDPNAWPFRGHRSQAQVLH